MSLLRGVPSASTASGNPALASESPNVSSVTLTLGVVANDLATARRIVGFFEYTNALQHLARFQAVASPIELRAADQIVQSRDEFTIFTNLSRLVNHDGESTVEKSAGNQKSDFERRGLGWVTAVARVELQAILAAFTSHPTPFMVHAPTVFDLDEYNNVLYDGMQSHYRRLEIDPSWKQERGAVRPTTRTLAYLRRLALLNSLSRAVITRLGPKFDRAMSTKMQSRLKSIQSAGQRLQQKVSIAVASSPGRGSMTAAEYRKLLQDCQAIKLR